jgi:integrase
MGSPQHKHLVRFILIGLYTGTRHRAILSLQWMPNTTGGWVDIERGVLYCRSGNEPENKKRKPPTRMSPRLIAHLRRWNRMDKGARFIIRYDGRMVKRLEKSFRGARAKAGLDETVTPHVLRHTRATWLMQAGVDIWEAAGSLGMTVETLQNTYGHQHPDFQKRAAEAY